MKRIIEYTIVFGMGTAEQFVDRVDTIMKKGWQPLGGVAMTGPHKTIEGWQTQWAQTFVKYEEDKS